VDIVITNNMEIDRITIEQKRKLLIAYVEKYGIIKFILQLIWK